MSATASIAKGGEFATSRRGNIDATERAFIDQKRAEGFPDFAIARMIGRSVISVQAIPKTVPAGSEPPLVFSQPKPKAAKPKPAIRRKHPIQNRPRPMPARVRQVIEALAQWHNVTVEDLIGPGKTWPLAHIRHEAFYVIRGMRKPDGDAAYSFPMIGAWFGGRDHTTIMYGAKAHEARLAEQRRAA